MEDTEEPEPWPAILHWDFSALNVGADHHHRLDTALAVIQSAGDAFCILDVIEEFTSGLEYLAEVIELAEAIAAKRKLDAIRRARRMGQLLAVNPEEPCQ